MSYTNARDGRYMRQMPGQPINRPVRERQNHDAQQDGPAIAKGGGLAQFHALCHRFNRPCGSSIDF
jgi:hypothetical protein